MRKLLIFCTCIPFIGTGAMLLLRTLFNFLFDLGIKKEYLAIFIVGNVIVWSIASFEI